MVITLSYIVLFLATTVYAWVLERHPNWTPDFTWFQVVAGTTMVLTVPTILALILPPMTGWQMLKLVYLAFVAGGMPIVIWQVALIIKRKDEIIENERRQGRVTKADAPTEKGPHQM
jgi:amino acid transporter